MAQILKGLETSKGPVETMGIKTCVDLFYITLDYEDIPFNIRLHLRQSEAP
jgi:hypothetical protein